jgi:cardiolipin synthase
MSRSLIVLPDETAKPILDAIDGAKESLRIKMFVFSDPAVLKAVMEAHGRGVKVRIMLNPTRRSGEADNEDTRKKLSDAGIEVIDSNPAFDLTHEKSMLVDGTTAFVKSLNWETKNFTETRDYAIVTRHKHEVDEIAGCFEADWNRKEFTPPANSNLIWCSSYGRDRIAEFIDLAKHTLFLQNERYQDAIIIERLVRAKGRGGRMKSSSCVVTAKRAARVGRRFTCKVPPRSSSLALACTQCVTVASAGPPLGGLYWKPPSSGGLCDGVMTIPSAKLFLRSRL